MSFSMSSDTELFNDPGCICGKSLISQVYPDIICVSVHRPTFLRKQALLEVHEEIDGSGYIIIIPCRNSQTPMLGLARTGFSTSFVSWLQDMGNSIWGETKVTWFFS